MTFTLSGNESILSAQYPAINLDPESEYSIGLISFETFNTIANVEPSNNKFYYIDSDGKDSVIEIPVGSYEISDINKFIRREIGIDRKKIVMMQIMKLSIFSHHLHLNFNLVA